MVALKNLGDGVVMIAHSGVVYHAERGAVVDFLPEDAARLEGHPLWEPVDEVTEDVPEEVLEGDSE